MSDVRLERLYALMEKRGIDAVALIPGANLYYLTGLQMHTSERVTLALFTKGGKGYLLLPSLEQGRVSSQLGSRMAFYPWGDEEGTAEAWRKLAADIGLAGKTIAVEYLNMRVLEHEELQRFLPGSKSRDAGSLLSDLRMTKDSAELESMRRAARVVETALLETLRSAEPGATERELAAEWQLSMKKCGADIIPEQPIVASGPNSEAPHTSSTDRALAQGDLVIFDGWCQVGGYFSDITRTVAVGEPSEELRKVYQIVLEANQAGRAAVRPGVQAQAIDRAARQVIDRAGYGSQFVHRTGHGLGIEIHEAPGIVEGNALVLQPGMTFTVEPGVYISGQGGVRIEDDVVVTQDGAETLTSFPRELMVL